MQAPVARVHARVCTLGQRTTTKNMNSKMPTHPPEPRSEDRKAFRARGRQQVRARRASASRGGAFRFKMMLGVLPSYLAASAPTPPSPELGRLRRLRRRTRPSPSGVSGGGKHSVHGSRRCTAPLWSAGQAGGGSGGRAVDWTVGRASGRPSVGRPSGSPSAGAVGRSRRRPGGARVALERHPSGDPERPEPRGPATQDQPEFGPNEGARRPCSWPKLWPQRRCSKAQ